MVDVPQASCNGPEDITNPNGGPTVKRRAPFEVMAALPALVA